MLKRSEVCEAVARSLREFGYPDVIAAMVGEILTAYLAGKRGNNLPHGIIGIFAEGQFIELEDGGTNLAAFLI